MRGGLFFGFGRDSNNCNFDSSVKNTNVPQKNFWGWRLVMTGTITAFFRWTVGRSDARTVSKKIGGWTVGGADGLKKIGDWMVGGADGLKKNRRSDQGGIKRTGGTSDPFLTGKTFSPTPHSFF